MNQTSTRFLSKAKGPIVIVAIFFLCITFVYNHTPWIWRTASVNLNAEPSPTCVLTAPEKVGQNARGIFVLTHEGARMFEKELNQKNQSLLVLGCGNGFQINGMICSNRHILGDAGIMSDGDIDFLNDESHKYTLPDLQLTDLDTPSSVFLTVKGFQMTTQKDVEISGQWYRFTLSDEEMKAVTLQKTNDRSLLTKVTYISQIPHEYKDFNFGGLSGSPAFDKDNKVFGVYSGRFILDKRYYFRVVPFHN
jgi:hypothetical protein